MGYSSWGSFSVFREWGLRGVSHVSTGFLGVLLVLMILRGIIDTKDMTIVILSLSTVVLFLDNLRLWAYTVNMPAWCQKLDHVAQKVFLRETETSSPCAAGRCAPGFVSAWIFTTIWAVNTLWIFMFVCLLFGLVDFCAKFGWRWPIKRFTSGFAKGKSWGGLLYGFLGGLLGILAVFCLNYLVIPIFPTTVSPIVVLVVYLVGAVSASLLELFTGKWDNAAITSGSAFLMNIAYLIFSFLN